MTDKHLGIGIQILRAACVGLALLSAPLANGAPHPGRKASNAPDRMIREQVTLKIGGIEEVWRLQWTSPPQPACDVDDIGWPTCPCAGFAFGERGNLDLVRLRGGKEIEQLPLTPMFEPVIWDWGRTAIVPRWPVLDGDDEASIPDSEAFAVVAHSRDTVPIMVLRDYDHDGHATEFALQVDSVACGKRMEVVIGVSSRNPRLHVFGTAEHPERPLVMRRDHWLALADASASITRVDWPCGDHGSDTETELELSAAAGDIHATKRFYECEGEEYGRRGALTGTNSL